MRDQTVSRWSDVIKHTLDIIYPPTCVSCEQGGAWWCKTCRQDIRLFDHQLCPSCGEFGEHDCQGTYDFNSLIACAPYGAPAVRRLITTLKYHSATCLKADLVDWLKSFRKQFAGSWPWAGYDRFIITHIPGDTARLRARGYDHTADLSLLIREAFAPWAQTETLLSKTKSTRPNAQLPADVLRTMNVKGAFVATRTINEPVLLIDDVFTTGATTNEAALALRAAGAPEVHVFILAKGGVHRDD